MPALSLPANWTRRPRLAEAGRDAAWLHLAALLYCLEHLTDGRVPAAMIPALTSHLAPDTATAAAAELCRVKLWRREGTAYWVDDEGTLPRRESVEYDRESARDRMRQHRANQRAARLPEGVDLDQLRDLTARAWPDDSRDRTYALQDAAIALGASDETRVCASLIIDLLLLGAEPPVAEAVILKDPQRAAEWLDHPERYANARNPAGLIIKRLREAQ